jgi:hypothetical protein
MVKAKMKAHSTDVRDYPAGMSLYERESLAAEAVLALKNKGKRPTKRKPR